MASDYSFEEIEDLLSRTISKRKQPQAREILGAYIHQGCGTASRLRYDCVKFSGGSIYGLQRLVEMATIDPRDVMQIECPRRVKLTRAPRHPRSS